MKVHRPIDGYRRVSICGLRLHKGIIPYSWDVSQVTCRSCRAAMKRGHIVRAHSRRNKKRRE